MGELPTIDLAEDGYYWVKDRYTDAVPAPWIVARWEVGSFWGPNGKEITPSVISGPIPQPLSGGRDDG